MTFPDCCYHWRKYYKDSHDIIQQRLNKPCPLCCHTTQNTGLGGGGLGQDGICKKSKRESYRIMQSFLLINNGSSQHFAHLAHFAQQIGGRIISWSNQFIKNHDLKWVLSLSGWKAWALGATLRDNHIEEIPEQDRDKQKSHRALERLGLENRRDYLLDEKELVLKQETLCNPCYGFIQVCAWGGLTSVCGF